MKSGDPEKRTDLQWILDQKRTQTGRTCEIVSEASAWMQGQLKGAGVAYHYAACDARDHYGYAVIVVTRWQDSKGYLLELRIAEVADEPYLFADVRMVGRSDSSLFPYFGELSTDDGRKKALHFVADFLLSTSATDRSP